ncbi:hypothetical protein [Malikia spinosa]|uniref:Uncharacterized protein n=1 Tax=Malikia spinosa TaxID=86180 RepID=A0A7C9IW66_9BURK|nr:hypothetical protein [Malikia spinosa]MYZ51169.1 hypothetical protein [Malikia spinosa]
MLALVEPGRVACLLVRVYLVELAGLDLARLPAIRWPGLSSGSASREPGPGRTGEHGQHRQPGHQIKPRTAIRCGAVLPQRVGRSSARAAAVRLCCWRWLSRAGWLVLLVRVFLVELAGPDLTGLTVIRWSGFAYRDFGPALLRAGRLRNERLSA